MKDDFAILARIYDQHVKQLDLFSKRVQEGRDVEAASDFARFLSFSGVIMLLERYPNQVQSNHPLKIDGSFLRWKCEQLIEACNERFRTNSLNPSFEKGEYESMHEKIDRVAGYLSRLTAARVINVEPMPEHHPESSASMSEPVTQFSAGNEQSVRAGRKDDAREFLHYIRGARIVQILKNVDFSVIALDVDLAHLEWQLT